MTTAEDPGGGRPGVPAADDRTSAFDAAALARTLAGDGSFALTVLHPSVDMCVVTVEGELDMLTAPLLDSCIRQHLAAVPAHLVLDLESVRFLDSKGLNCLLEARKLTQQTFETQLHVTGLVTLVVARPLEITGLLTWFDTYPTLSDALAALAD